MKSLDTYRGCIIGGAAGDALGYTIEFISEYSIFQRYGERGITEYKLTNGIAQFSDDTQMTLFTAAGLLSARARHLDNSDSYLDMISQSYLDWYRTQTERYPMVQKSPVSWLVNVPELYSPRAPGNTCLSACRQGAKGTIDHPLNHSCGCGGVMRAAPVGLYCDAENTSMSCIQRLGAGAAALTHGHELGWLPAAALSSIVNRLAHDSTATVLSATQETMELLPETFPHTKHLPKLLQLMDQAIALSQSDTPDLDAIHHLGEGWVGQEALAIALYCALKYPNDFDRALIVSVNHKGDSDSTGAITGNLLGASLGLSGIPQKYREHLERYDVLLTIADDLYHVSELSEYSTDSAWEHKYIDCDWKPEDKT